jgi:hypothetical protein
MPNSAIHEVFRYRRGDEVRIYRFHVVHGGTQLWRVTERPGQPSRSVMETSFTRLEEAADFLEEVQRALTAGGWKRL